MMLLVVWTASCSCESRWLTSIDGTESFTRPDASLIPDGPGEAVCNPQDPAFCVRRGSPTTVEESTDGGRTFSEAWAWPEDRDSFWLRDESGFCDRVVPRVYDIGFEASGQPVMALGQDELYVRSADGTWNGPREAAPWSLQNAATAGTLAYLILASLAWPLVALLVWRDPRIANWKSAALGALTAFVSVAGFIVGRVAWAAGLYDELLLVAMPTVLLPAVAILAGKALVARAPKTFGGRSVRSPFNTIAIVALIVIGVLSGVVLVVSLLSLLIMAVVGAVLTTLAVIEALSGPRQLDEKRPTLIS